MKQLKHLILLIFPLFGAVLLLQHLFRPVQPSTAVCVPFQHRIVLDAGHGGMDGGAVGTAGTLEKDINLRIAQKCELLLVLLGVDVTMTRREDCSLDDGSGATIAGRKAEDIRVRVAMANSGADALVSIHMNTFPVAKYWGTQVFYSENHPDSAVLADRLQTAARQLLAPDNRRESRQAENSIYLLRHVLVPAVIVECGFLSNPEEERRLNSDEYQNAVAEAICGGIIHYLYHAA